MAFVIFSIGLQFHPLTNNSTSKYVGHQMIMIMQRCVFLVLAGGKKTEGDEEDARQPANSNIVTLKTISGTPV